MKNLKGIVFGFIAMIAMIGGVSAVDYTECNSIKDAKFYVKGSDSTTYSCQTTITNALSNAKAGDEIILLDDYSPAAAHDLTGDVIIDLNGHKLTLTKALTVRGANVTIKNGTINAAGQMLKVDSSSDESTLTIADNVKVEGNNQNVAFIKVINATKKTEINVNGTWSLKNEIVDCDSVADKNLTINLNATVEGDKTLVTLDAGTSTVNVLGGSYVSAQTVFSLTNGTLNISGGTIKSTGGSSIVINNPNSGKSALNITGGDISTTATGKYSLYFGSGSSSTNATYSISYGTFTSGKDNDGNQLPAIYIGSQGFLTNHPGIITGGTFTNAIVGNVQVENGKIKYASAATNILIAEGTPSTEDNGSVIVGTSNTDDQNQVIDEDNVGGTTDSGEANPNTADVNLMTLVGTILVGLAGLAYTAKRRLFN